MKFRSRVLRRISASFCPPTVLSLLHLQRPPLPKWPFRRTLGNFSFFAILGGKHRFIYLPANTLVRQASIPVGVALGLPLGQ